MSQERGKKISEEQRARPHMCWPVALRAVRGWLEPWIMLRRYWRAWSEQPLPPLLQRLLDQLGRGQGLFLYSTFCLVLLPFFRVQPIVWIARLIVARIMGMSCF